MGNNMTIFYCRKCVFPSSRPLLTFNKQGVCSACTGNEKKKKVDWAKREEEFSSLVYNIKELQKGYVKYDVVVPVSGGKDSIYQVHTALKYGLKVLAVTVDYGIKTEIGRQNLEVISNMGADLLTFRPDQKLHKKLIKDCFLRWGDPDLMSHSLLYSYPMWIAKEKNIPLVLYGENPAFEYVGDTKFFNAKTITGNWFDRYVVNFEKYIEARKMVEKGNSQFLRNYSPPVSIFKRTRFLGYYFPWSSESNRDLALSLGFKTVEKDVGTYRNYVGIDEIINRVHQYMKLVIFGYGRATDHACEDIRTGKLNRAQAINMVETNDSIELDENIKVQFCDHINIPLYDFEDTINRLQNLEIWCNELDYTYPRHSTYKLVVRERRRALSVEWNRDKNRSTIMFAPSFYNFYRKG